MNRTKLITALGTMLAASTVMSAHAQQQDGDFFARDRYEAVTDRYQQDFDPEPVRLGTFRLNSSLRLGVEADDNVFADAENTESDVTVAITPTADLRSDWARNEVAGRVQVEHREYTDLGSESATQLRGELRGRLDVTRDFDLNGVVFASDEVEERRNVANLDVFEEPVSFQTAGARVGARFQRDRLRARVEGEQTDYSYDDVPLVGGGDFSLEERDYTFQRARTRVSYALSPDVAVFGQAEINARDYSLPVFIDGNSADRDSEGYAVQVGSNFELPFLIRGDVAIGYLEDTKESSVFADVSGLSLEADVQWFPTRLTTVSFEAGRNVIDPGLATSGSAVATDFSVRVDHELLRNVLLFGEAGMRQRDYEDVDRDDDLVDLRVGATYKMNKRFHFDGYLQRFDRDSSVANGNFEQNVIGVALRIFP